MKVLLLSLLFSVQAFAGERYHCTSTGGRDYTVMDLERTETGVTGVVQTTGGSVEIGSNKRGDHMFATLENGVVSIEYYPAHDISTVKFELSEGKHQAEFYEFIDCVGEQTWTGEVECTKQP